MTQEKFWREGIRAAFESMASLHLSTETMLEIEGHLIERLKVKTSVCPCCQRTLKTSEILGICDRCKAQETAHSSPDQD